MKTPEQIADEQMRAFTVLNGFDGYEEDSDVEECSAGYIREQIVAAIEADRAQRKDDMATIANAASCWATELTDYVIPGADATDAPSYETECEKIQAALGRYLDELEAR